MYMHYASHLQAVKCNMFQSEMKADTEWLTRALQKTKLHNKMTLAEEKLIQENVDQFNRYKRICGLLLRYDAWLNCSSTPSLVSYSFPTPLLPHIAMQLNSGIATSFFNFIQGLARTNEQITPHRIMDLDGHVWNKMTLIASVIETESRLCIQGACESTVAVQSICIRLESLARNEIEEECKRMKAKLPALKRLEQAFSMWQHDERFAWKSSKITTAGAWLRALRTNDGVDMLLQLRTQDEKFAEMLRCFSGWPLAQLTLRHPRDYTDANAIDLYDTLCVCSTDMKHWLQYEIGRIEKVTLPCASSLVSQRGWSGVCVVDQEDTTSLHITRHAVQPPAHMMAFSGGGVWLREDTDIEYSHCLLIVRIVRVVCELLRNGKLPLDRIGNAYAREVVRFEFASYERACEMIMNQVIAPFSLRAGVPLASNNDSCKP